MFPHEAKRRRLNAFGDQGAEVYHRGSNSESKHILTVNGPNELNLFQLQIDELLVQLRPKYDKCLSRVEKSLWRLRSVIESIPARPAKKIPEAKNDLLKNSGVAIPFPDPQPLADAKYPLEYSPPSQINIVGRFSFHTETHKGIGTSIDLAVTMPTALFQQKDYTKYRYFYKRAYYVACLAAGIGKDRAFNVQYNFQDGNSLCPIVSVTPGADADESFIRSRITIRIITAVEDIFPLTQTLPMANSIRDEHSDHTCTAEVRSIYNSTLRSEATVISGLKLLHLSSAKSPGFRDACLLGQTWLLQRGFGSSFSCGGFGSFEWAVLICLLFRSGGSDGKPLISHTHSGFQIFKATVQFLATRNLFRPFVFGEFELEPLEYDAPVLFDGKQGLNIFYKLSPWSYQLLRHESRLALDMLNDPTYDNFVKLFIWKINNPLCTFDQLLKLPGPGTISSLELARYYHSLYKVLTRALGDRARLVHISPSYNYASWPIQKRIPSYERDSPEIVIGLFLNPHKANRLVDHGPSPELKEKAASFRRFWGDKSELRRFKDGNILESLLWSDKPSDCSVVQQIVCYIVFIHFGINPVQCTSISDRIWQDLQPTPELFGSMELFNPIMDAYNSIEAIFRTLGDLPLTFHHLAPSSPFLRYSSLSTIIQGIKNLGPVDLVLQLEGSTRWPDDLRAIQMTKLAFLLRIAELTQSSDQVSSCKIGLENDSSRILNLSFLDVTHESGMVFRIRLHHDREQTLLERLLKYKGSGIHSKEEIAFALAEYKQRFVHSPKHTQAIRSLCTRYPSLSTSIRIFKRWAYSHLFLPHVCEELLELLVAKTFVSPYPWDSPCHPISGFFRTLYFLSQWDWQHEPLIVDLNQELNQPDLADIRTKFDAWRNIDPNMNSVSMFVASNIDRDGTTWTQFSKPPKVIAARISSLAKASIKLVKNEAELYIPDIMSSPLTDYDFIIHLSPRVTKSHFKNLSEFDAMHAAERAQLNSAFVDELQRLYGSSIVFFYNTDLEIVAGLWNPFVTKDRLWGLKVQHSSIPVGCEGDSQQQYLSLNQTAILSEIATLGGHLVQRIQIREH